MQPNEPNDREGRDPAEAQGPAHEEPSLTRDAPLTPSGAVPSAYDPEPPAQAEQSGVDDELPDADARAGSASDAPATEADAIGYDDPSQSPVRALRDAADEEGTT